MEGYRLAMKAIVCEQFGPVSDLRLVERESAAVGPGDVRIAVTACGVNYVDGLFVQGKYQIKPPVPFVPGMELLVESLKLALTSRLVRLTIASL